MTISKLMYYLLMDFFFKGYPSFCNNKCTYGKFSGLYARAWRPRRAACVGVGMAGCRGFVGAPELDAPTCLVKGWATHRYQPSAGAAVTPHPWQGAVSAWNVCQTRHCGLIWISLITHNLVVI